MKRVQLEDGEFSLGTPAGLERLPSLGDISSPLGLLRVESALWPSVTPLNMNLGDEAAKAEDEADDLYLSSLLASPKQQPPQANHHQSSSSHELDTALMMDDISEEDSIRLDASEEQSDSPPRFALDYESHLDNANTYLSIVQQPPREVRTRKKKEKRPFSVKVMVKSLQSSNQTRRNRISCRLVFADDFSAVPEESECSQSIEIKGVGTIVAFEGLGIMNPCLKWKDREFCVEIEIDGIPESRLRTRRIYSYSNLGVLQRRRQVEVAGLSARFGTVTGGMRMHLVGKPFFKSDRLKVVFRVFCNKSKRWVTLEAGNLEFYSESVLFFDTPRVPLSTIMESSGSGLELKAFVQVTNDGSNFSNGLEFSFKTMAGVNPKRFRSDDELHQARL